MEIVVFVLVVIIAVLFALLVHKPIGAKQFSGGRDKLLKAVKKFSTPHLGDSTAVILRDETAKVIKGAETLIDFSQITHSMSYAPSDTLVKTTLHNGQLKLFLTELQFLTSVLPKNDSPCIVVYAGSSPCHKLGFLSELFPATKFVCVDPNEHLIMFDQSNQYSSRYISKFLYFVVADGDRFTIKNRRVNFYDEGIIPREAKKSIPDNIAEIILNGSETYYMIEDYLDDELSAKLAPLTSCGLPFYFISDIRSRNEKAESPTSLDILWNSALMYNWLKIMKPQKFMLKFHPPYTITDRELRKFEHELLESPWVNDALGKCPIPFVENYRARKFTFIKGESIWIQAFAGQSSSETRLIGSTLDTIDYDLMDYENRFYYYNKIHRPYGWHTNHEACLDKNIGIDRCGDCALMCQIFSDYWLKYRGTTDGGEIKSAISRLLGIIQRNIKNRYSHHGKYYSQFPTISAIVDCQEYLLIIEEVDKYQSYDMFMTKDEIAANFGAWEDAIEYISSKYSDKSNITKNTINPLLYVNNTHPLAWAAMHITASRWLSRGEIEDLRLAVLNKKKITGGSTKRITSLAKRIVNFPFNGISWNKLYDDLSSKYKHINLLVSSIPVPIIHSPNSKVVDLSGEFFQEKYDNNHLIIVRLPETTRVVLESVISFCRKQEATSLFIHRKNKPMSQFELSPHIDFVKVYNNITSEDDLAEYEIGFINMPEHYL